MAMTKEGEEKLVEEKGEKSFSTGYIAPTMEVINKKTYYFGGVELAEPDLYKWAEYKKTEEMVEHPETKRKQKRVTVGEINNVSQKMEGGFFLYRDKRTDKAYILTRDGKVKKI